MSVSKLEWYGAQPIRSGAKEYAQRFVDLLPARFRGPDLTAHLQRGWPRLR